MSMRCEICERQLAADEPIWHLRMMPYKFPHPLYSDDERQSQVRNVCRGCCEREGWLGDKTKNWQPPRPCQQCGRPLHWSGRCPMPQHFVCSWECKSRAYWGNRYTPRPAPKRRACPTCNKGFYPKRSDTRFCSAACKQRAYREHL